GPAAGRPVRGGAGAARPERRPGRRPAAGQRDSVGPRADRTRRPLTAPAGPAPSPPRIDDAHRGDTPEPDDLRPSDGRSKRCCPARVALSGSSPGRAGTSMLTATVP